jgi:hypothetical protein
MRAGDDSLVIFSLTADQRDREKAFQSLRILMLDANANSESFRQQNLRYDAVCVPCIPATRQPLLELRILGRTGLWFRSLREAGIQSQREEGHNDEA